MAQYYRKQTKVEDNLNYNFAVSTHDATGVYGCERSLLSAPKEKLVIRKKNKTEVNTFRDSGIRRKVHELYAVKKSAHP